MASTGHGEDGEEEKRKSEGKRKREEEGEDGVKRRREDDGGSEDEEPTPGMATTGHGEDGEEEKRKREEEGKDGIKRRRGDDDRGSEDEEPAPGMASTGHGEDGKEEKRKREEEDEDGVKRRREDDGGSEDEEPTPGMASTGHGEDGKEEKRKREEEGEDGVKWRRGDEDGGSEDEEPTPGMASTGHGEDGKEEKRKREEEGEDGVKWRRGDEDGGSEDEEPTPGMASTEHEEDGKEEKRKSEGKRKREEEGEDGVKRRRDNENGGSEDEESTPGSSQGTSGPYPRLTISHYNLHQVLGRGNFGKVVLASVPGRDTYMAIKIINRREDNEGTIKRERRILLAARDCPFLCHLYAAHQSLERAYFITEYLSGGSLEDLIRICCYLDINNIRFYAAEMVCGLQFLHGQNIVHRDLKPENIMLDAEGHIRIIDLGLAQDGVTASSKIDGVTGTFCYMAPEVLLGQKYYTAVDWWSLGIVLCRMATGRFPFFIGHSKQKVFKAITRKEPKLPPGMDAAIEHLISQLLRKNPDKRLGVRRNIRKHPFFSTIRWEELEERRAKPPCGSGL
ncbi:protein kinase C delta type-like isoform X2 [Hyla sarda]|uniref:protein kinase C delta type-like isoform X2 n=1 Tax=Hyla sarda TaxID=327740 RepID=UPI0024C3A6C0|nr:protein kinase C delta type-like isoform X2 [Hyla sarda]